MSIFSEGEESHLARMCLWVFDKDIGKHRVAYWRFPIVFGGDAVRVDLKKVMMKHYPQIAPVTWAIPNDPFVIGQLEKMALEDSLTANVFNFMPLSLRTPYSHDFALSFSSNDEVDRFEQIRKRHDAYWRKDAAIMPQPPMLSFKDDNIRA